MDRENKRSIHDEHRRRRFECVYNTIPSLFLCYQKFDTHTGDGTERYKWPWVPTSLFFLVLKGRTFLDIIRWD